MGIKLYLGGDKRMLLGERCAPLGPRCFAADQPLKTRYTPEEVVQLEILLDSGAFGDSAPNRSRLSVEAALDRQLAWERKAGRLWGAEVRSIALAAYDQLGKGSSSAPGGGDHAGQIQDPVTGEWYDPEWVFGYGYGDMTDYGPAYMGNSPLPNNPFLAENWGEVGDVWMGMANYLERFALTTANLRYLQLVLHLRGKPLDLWTEYDRVQVLQAVFEQAFENPWTFRTFALNQNDTHERAWMTALAYVHMLLEHQPPQPGMTTHTPTNYANWFNFLYKWDKGGRTTGLPQIGHPDAPFGFPPRGRLVNTTDPRGQSGVPGQHPRPTPTPTPPPSPPSPPPTPSPGPYIPQPGEPYPPRPPAPPKPGGRSALSSTGAKAPQGTRASAAPRASTPTAAPSTRRALTRLNPSLSRRRLTRPSGGSQMESRRRLVRPVGESRRRLVRPRRGPASGRRKPYPRIGEPPPSELELPVVSPGWDESLPLVLRAAFRSPALPDILRKVVDAPPRRRLRREPLRVYDGHLAVEGSLEAAAYLTRYRRELHPRRLILNAQGLTVEQYTLCVDELLRMAGPEDWLGLGGFCTIGWERGLLPRFVETVQTIVPWIAQAGVQHIHVYGVLHLPALAVLQWHADQHGLSVSTDSGTPLLDYVRQRKPSLPAHWREHVAAWQAKLDQLHLSPHYGPRLAQPTVQSTPTPPRHGQRDTIYTAH